MQRDNFDTDINLQITAEYIILYLCKYNIVQYFETLTNENS